MITNIIREIVILFFPMFRKEYYYRGRDYIINVIFV